MELVKKIILCLLVVGCSACEFDPLKFVITTYDVNQRFADSKAYNESNPKQDVVSPSEDYAFMLSSDLHLQLDSTFLPQLRTYLAADTALFSFYNGDLYSAKEEYADFTLEALNNLSSKPYFVAAGNHDMYFSWQIFFDRFGSSSYTYCVNTPSGKDLYIVLESASATLGQDQTRWLEAVLSTRAQYRYAFILTHCNFIPEGFNNGIFQDEELHALYKLFKDNRVTAVFSGHSHIQHQENILGVKYVTTGALKNGEFATISVHASDGITAEFKKL